ncbi:serine/threonine protein kinase [Sorangium sp. So ce128]|uniref:serine/threonine protein kinase n=1 Tax=Sorangium sp. So ce128 TaxID=3133281 RepID=UPI003F5F1E89
MKTTKQGFPIVKSDRTLYRYVIKKLLGSGGFGDVYEAELFDLNLSVALKRFRVKPGSTASVLESWANESETHDSLSHPNILQVFDAFECEGFLYMATELATASLDHCTPAEGWDESEVMRAGIQIASALHYMHTAWGAAGPLIHRDVTPNNIFYFQGKSIFKIGDFGIAKQLDGQYDVAVTQVANWSFVAPELARGDFSVPQSDLFQLGLVLYFMAQGESAIDSSLPIAKKKQAIVDGAAHQSAKDAIFLSDKLQQCIKRLLLRDRVKRYSSAKSVVADLRAAHKEFRELYES